MGPTSAEFFCFHCKALVPESDIAGGWCESCGKKLPESIRSRKKREGQAPKAVDVDLPAGAPASRLLWGAAVVVALAVAAFLLLAKVGMAG